jgi:hypothetical protein
LTAKIVTLDYTPRPHFVDFHQRDERWALMVCHRRAGKTVACVNDLVLKGIYTKKDNARFGYVAPFRQQAKEIAWTYLKDATDGIRDGPPRESELRVKLHNGAWITLYGADNPDAFRGLYFDGLILDEYGDMRPSLMGEVIIPALTDRQGWLGLIGTSKGRNQFFTAARRAEQSTEWYYKMLRASESNILPEEDLARAKEQMTPEEYEQEFECSFDAAVKGTYYAGQINQAEKDRRIDTTPLYDPDQKVHVAADIGYRDSCAFWFWQPRPDGFALIDYYEKQSKTLDHYLTMLHNKQYDYEHIWLPHDAKAKTLQTGRSTLEQMLTPHVLCPELYPPDFRFNIRIVPKLKVQQGIDAARLILTMCYFDKTTTFNGLEALRSYQRQWHDHTQTFSNTPLHNWASHGSDAFRYFALVAQKSRGQAAEHHLNRRPRLSPDDLKPKLTLDGLFKEREKLNMTNKWRI